MAELGGKIGINRYRPLNLPLSCEIAKKVFLDPRFVGEGIPQISDMHIQITLNYFRACGRIWFSSVQRAQRLEGEKKKERKKEERKNPW